MSFLGFGRERDREYLEKHRLDNAERIAREEAARETYQEKKKKYDEEGVPFCPRCTSTYVTANKKGFGLGKAAAGGVLLGPVGLLGGMIGKNKMTLYCMKCGHKFEAHR